MKKLLAIITFLAVTAVGISALEPDSVLDWSSSGAAVPSPAVSMGGTLFAVWIESPLGKDLEFKVNQEVTFEGAATQEVKEWKWGFGDGKTATGQKAVHKFTKKGEMKVVLTASAKETSFGSDSDELAVKIVEKPAPIVIEKKCSTILECLSQINQRLVQDLTG